jgi:hypothetical protein
LFIDSFKCNGPAEFSGFVSYVDAGTRAASVEFFSGHVNQAVVERGLLRFFSTYWVPRVIRVDNGMEFAGLERFLADYEVRIVRGSVAHPMSQGLVERFHRTILSLIRLQNSDEDWPRRAQRALYVYMRSPHKGLGGRSPLQAVSQVLSDSEIINTIANTDYIEDDSELIDDDDGVRVSSTSSPPRSQDVQEEVVADEAEAREPEMVSAEESRSEDPQDEFQVGQRVLWDDPNSIRRKDLHPLKPGIVTETKGRGAYVVQFDKPEGGGRAVTRMVNAARLAADTAQEDPASPEEAAVTTPQQGTRRSTRSRRPPAKYTPS